MDGERERVREHLAAIRATLAAATPPDPGRRLGAGDVARIRKRLNITEPDDTEAPT